MTTALEPRAPRDTDRASHSRTGGDPTSRRGVTWRRRMVWPGILVTAGALAAACSSTSTTSTPPSTSTVTAAPASTGSSGSASDVIHVAKVGNLGVILTDAKGMTLYRYTPDKPNMSVCTGECASLWPPMTVPAGTTTVSAASGAGGTFGTIKRSDGTTQVTYNGMPLYTYQGDSKSGEATGQGLDGQWFVLKAMGSATSATTGSANSTSTTSSGGSSGY
jgi:predicted lipoprotein with Yx(FWY)xxD motif